MNWRVAISRRHRLGTSVSLRRDRREVAGYAAPTGAEVYLGLVFYRDVAPMVLGTAPACAEVSIFIGFLGGAGRFQGASCGWQVAGSVRGGGLAGRVMVNITMAVIAKLLM